MKQPWRFNPATHAVGLDHAFLASEVPNRPGPPIPVNGTTFGVASMAENPPHNGEMHPDGDEILYLISGKANVVFVDGDESDIEMRPGDGLVIPKGVWHRVDILTPCNIVYLTPGPGKEFRPLAP